MTIQYEQMTSKKCPVCGGEKIEEDNSTSTVCFDCGFILGESQIVSEVTFGQDKSVVESYLSHTQPQGLSESGRGAGFGNRSESRQLTIQKGNRNIKQVGSQLSLSSQHIEAAQRLFLVAVQHSFLQGRKSNHVIAACLYIVCRREKTPHLLIDFADLLQTNLYVLGSTYLKFVRLLNLSLPIVDPSLFIRRFAAKLEFGDKTNTVAMTALRLVARMKRDWLQVGRRPSGICGAALLLAGRIHGFKRTQKEIVRVVRTAELTIRTRLEEFVNTPAGDLTVEQFNEQDIESSSEFNPPAFTSLKKREKAQHLLLLTDGNDLDKEMTLALKDDKLKAAAKDLGDQAEKEQSKEHANPGSQSSISSTAVVDAGGSLVPMVPTMASEGTDTFSDVDDDEMNTYLLSEREIKFKSKMWKKMNSDWLADQKEKQRVEQEQLALGIAPKKRYIVLLNGHTTLVLHSQLQ